MGRELGREGVRSPLALHRCTFVCLLLAVPYSPCTVAALICSHSFLFPYRAASSASLLFRVTMHFMPHVVSHMSVASIRVRSHCASGLVLASCCGSRSFCCSQPLCLCSSAVTSASRATARPPRASRAARMTSPVMAQAARAAPRRSRCAACAASSLTRATPPGALSSMAPCDSPQSAALHGRGPLTLIKDFSWYRE